MKQLSPSGAPPEQKPPSRRRSRILLGAVLCLGILLFGALLMRAVLEPPAKEKAAAVDTATLDLKALVAAHPSYDHLQELIAERQAIKEDLATLLDVPLTVSAAVPEVKPFQDAVMQKNAQDVIGHRAELERKQKKAAQAREQETRPDYEASRDAINAEYWNEILNIKLKLDNQQAMRLTDETVAQLKERLSDLESERGARQIALYRSWQAEIKSYAQSAVAGEVASSKQTLADLRAQRDTEAQNAQAAAEARNLDAIQAQMQDSIARQQQAQAKQADLAAKEAEITALEGKILNDIASRAAKIAILHHYTLIVSDPARSLDGLLPASFRPQSAEKYVKTITVHADDVTDEVKDDLTAHPPEDAAAQENKSQA